MKISKQKQISKKEKTYNENYKKEKIGFFNSIKLFIQEIKDLFINRKHYINRFTAENRMLGHKTIFKPQNTSSIIQSIIQNMVKLAFNSIVGYISIYTIHFIIFILPSFLNIIFSLVKHGAADELYSSILKQLEKAFKEVNLDIRKDSLSNNDVQKIILDYCSKNNKEFYHLIKDVLTKDNTNNLKYRILSTLLNSIFHSSLVGGEFSNVIQKMSFWQQLKKMFESQEVIPLDYFSNTQGLPIINKSYIDKLLAFITFPGIFHVSEIKPLNTQLHFVIKDILQNLTIMLNIMNFFRNLIEENVIHNRQSIDTTKVTLSQTDMETLKMNNSIADSIIYSTSIDIYQLLSSLTILIYFIVRFSILLIPIYNFITVLFFSFVFMFISMNQLLYMVLSKNTRFKLEKIDKNYLTKISAFKELFETTYSASIHLAGFLILSNMSIVISLFPTLKQIIISQAKEFKSSIFIKPDQSCMEIMNSVQKFDLNTYAENLKKFRQMLGYVSFTPIDSLIYLESNVQQECNNQTIKNIINDKNFNDFKNNVIPIIKEKLDLIKKHHEEYTHSNSFFTKINSLLNITDYASQLHPIIEKCNPLITPLHFNPLESLEIFMGPYIILSLYEILISSNLAIQIIMLSIILSHSIIRQIITSFYHLKIAIKFIFTKKIEIKHVNPYYIYSYKFNIFIIIVGIALLMTFMLIEHLPVMQEEFFIPQVTLYKQTLIALMCNYILSEQIKNMFIVMCILTIQFTFKQILAYYFSYKTFIDYKNYIFELGSVFLLNNQ